eukprot:TRINITY_DN24708_c0_g1_i1.p1 TRINITY_DN24708_c0_g1~~TRINITY_DN24708_c0_g1_i1.p1  ORF type:complete len:221 (+),score=18.33 TRINITY_DN24708_c0_g1_i1:84-746(+)
MCIRDSTKFQERFRGRINLISRQGTLVSQPSFCAKKKWAKPFFENYSTQFLNHTDNVASDGSSKHELLLNRRNGFLKIDGRLKKSASNAKINKKCEGLCGNSLEHNKCENMHGRSQLGPLFYLPQRLVAKKCSSKMVPHNKAVSVKSQHQCERLKLPLLPKGRSSQSVISQYSSCTHTDTSMKRVNLKSMIGNILEKKNPKRGLLLLKDRIEPLYLKKNI